MLLSGQDKAVAASMLSEISDKINIGYYLLFQAPLQQTLQIKKAEPNTEESKAELQISYSVPNQ